MNLRLPRRSASVHPTRWCGFGASRLRHWNRRAQKFIPAPGTLHVRLGFLEIVVLPRAAKTETA